MELTQNTGTKTLLGLVMAVMTYMWSNVTALIFVAACALVLDYFVGTVAGMMKSGGFNRTIAINGIIKKAGSIFLMVVGFLGDYTIYAIVKTFGYDLMGVSVIGDIPVAGMLGFALTIYIIGTELFSSVQNLIRWGTKAPSWLLKIFALMRDSSGKIIKLSQGEGEPQENDGKTQDSVEKALARELNKSPDTNIEKMKEY